MTGLSPGTDTILSVSCLLTDHNLTLLDTTGFDAVTHHSEQQLNNMSEWCVTTHGRSGLTQACLSSTTSAETAAKDLLAYIQRFIPQKGVALLAGNSIHADKMFLMQPPWNTVLEYFHYRLFDVSAMKEMVRRWSSDEVLRGAPRKQVMHEARGDVEESLEEARYYKKILENAKAP